MPKLYKTAQGRTVDIGAIMTQNERTRAVGNMKVNARGDVIDNQNKVVMPRNRQVNRDLNAGVDKQVVAKSTTRSAERPVKKSNLVPDALPQEPVVAKIEPTAPLKGIAGALARANQPKESR
jgi:hypothetical protein